jgi:hypothetical protein
MTNYYRYAIKNSIGYNRSNKTLIYRTYLYKPAPKGADSMTLVVSRETIILDEQAVFLALQGSLLFKKDGPRGLEEDEEIVRKVIHRRWNQESMKALLEEYGLIMVRLYGVRLHTAGVFTSEDLAAARFLDLYRGEGDKAEDIPVYLPLLIESQLLALVQSGLTYGLYVYI